MKNREIKFRFWDKELKKMFYRKPATYDFNHPNIIPMQYTGFKDSEGNEIYEGDKLIDLDLELKDDVKIESTTQQVYWCEKYGEWKLDNTFNQDKSDGFNLAKDLRDYIFNVYGNIYEK